MADLPGGVDFNSISAGSLIAEALWRIVGKPADQAKQAKKLIKREYLVARKLAAVKYSRLYV